jgi:hypothetical protein
MSTYESHQVRSLRLVVHQQQRQPLKLLQLIHMLDGKLVH